VLSLALGFGLAVSALGLATSAVAEPVSGPFASDLNQAKRGVDGMLKRATQLKLSQRGDAKAKVAQIMEELGAVMAALHAVDTVGRDGWFRVEGESCPEVCDALGLVSDYSPEGAMCASGEVRPESAIGIVQFTKGCWPNCAPDAPGVVVDAASVGKHCYKPGQKRDNDRTDLTVGCFCN
jgi:hypothetical protein